MSGDSVSSTQEPSLSHMPVQVPPTNGVVEVFRRQTTLLNNLAIETSRGRHKEITARIEGKSLFGDMMKGAKGY